MKKELFSNNIFRIVFIVFVGLDLINTIFSISSSIGSTSILIFNYLMLLLTICAFLSLFIVTKYSLVLIKIYIILKLIIVPTFMLFYALKEFVVYSYNPFTIDKYFGFVFNLLIGIVFYYFFKKYKVENLFE
jgi:hypothetical protein